MAFPTDEIKIAGLAKTEILWKYLDTPKFISMLAKQAIWLNRVDKFRDRHEGRIPLEMMGLIEKAFHEKLDSTSIVKTPEEFEEYLKANTYVSCWHRNEIENMAMWEIYGRSESSIAVKTTVEKLIKSISLTDVKGTVIQLKPVEYITHDSYEGEVYYENCSYIKRPEYAYENEVRISLDTYSPHCPNKNTPLGYNLSCDVANMIDSIVIHPDSADWFREVVESICDKYDLKVPIETSAGA